jgi:hypothetical protein
MNEENADMQHDALRLVREAEEVQSMIEQELARRYESCFRKPMHILINMTEYVQRFVYDHEPEYRSLALCFLGKHGGGSESTKTILLQKAREDLCPRVRACAITNLGSLLEQTKDPDIARALKGIVYDDHEDVRVRKEAYFAISCVDRFDNLLMRDSFTFPEEVDWDRLESLVPDD